MVISLLKNRTYAFLSSLYGGSKYKNELPLIKRISLLVVIVLFVQATTSFTLLLKKPVKAFVDLGCEFDLFFLLGNILFFTCLMINIFLVRPQLYDSKDNDNLLSLPIKHSSIVISRMLSVYMINLFLVLVIGAAVFIDCIIAGGKMSVISCLIYLFELCSISFLALGFSFFIGWFFSLITIKSGKRDLLFTFLSVITFTVSLIIFGFSLYNLLMYKADTDISFMKKALYIFYLFTDGIINNILSFIIFLFISIFILIVAGVLISNSFLKMCTFFKKNKEVSKAIENYNSSPYLIAMMKKELRLILKEKIYLINAGFGCLLLLILSCIILFDKSLVYKLTSDIKLLSLIFIAVSCTANSFNTFTAPSISLEGESLWLPKSLPIRPSYFFLSKALAHIVISLPTTFIYATVVNISYDMDILCRICIYILPLAMIVLFSLIGIFMNTKYPYFDFVNVTAAVKQSMSVLLSMLLNSAINSLPILFYIILHKVVNNSIYLSFTFIVIVAVDILLYIEMNKKSISWFERLNGKSNNTLKS